ncbi:MAG: hypothetical protein ABI432_08550 [Flavobacteriales bacterium]
MRHLLLALLCISATFRSVAQTEPGGTRLNAMVTVRVSGMDEALWSKVNARVMKEPNANVEYSCIATGIIVLRMRNLAITEKSDVMALVRRILTEAGVKGQIDYLDVHVEPGDGNRC